MEPVRKINAVDSASADALIVVDVQNAFVAGSGAVPNHSELREATRVLLERARAAGVLIVFLQNDGPPGAVDEPHRPGWELYFTPWEAERIIRKTTDDGFDGTVLNGLLESSRVSTIAICGVQSEMCVAATARSAMARGYVVVLPHDGHATYHVPPGPGGSEGVPAAMAARAAEWSLGDEVLIVPSVHAVGFASRLMDPEVLSAARVRHSDGP